MTTTALYATQKIMHLRYQCPHCHAVVSYCTKSLPPQEQWHQCLKPLQCKIVCLKGSQDAS